MSSSAHVTATHEPLGRGIAAILITGAALGVVYNAFGLESSRRWGLPWIGEDRAASLETVSAAPDPYRTEVDDPLAVAAAGSARAGLPEIPAAGRPVQIELGPVKSYVDASAALVIDARDRGECEASRIPGAICLPYDEAATDPARLESIDPAGRPIIVYCGGGTCEVSINLAYELIAAGKPRVAVYMGGFPEWAAAGYPVEPAGASR